jgi:hypothetical protein
MFQDNTVRVMCGQYSLSSPLPSHPFAASLRFRVPCASTVTKLVIIFSQRRDCAGLCPTGARLAHRMFLLLIDGPQAKTSRGIACGQRACLTHACIHLNDSPRAILDATTQLHDQIVAIREHRRALKTALAQVHGARSSEPHTLLVSLEALGDSDDESDEEEDNLGDLDIRASALSLAETADGSMQFFGTGPSSLALERRAPAPMLPTASTLVSWITFRSFSRLRLITR